MRDFRAKALQPCVGAWRDVDAFDGTTIVTGMADDLREFALAASGRRNRLASHKRRKKRRRQCEEGA